MLKQENIIEKFKIQFRRFEESLNGQKEQPLHGLRKKAIETLEEIGIPTTKDEEWRFTDLSPLFEKSFRLLTKEQYSQLSPDAVKPFLYREFNGPQFVFVDGVFSPELSTQIDDDMFGIVLTSLKQFIRQEPQVLNALAGDGFSEKNAFAALNTAFATDGMVIQIPDNIVFKSPINILYLSSDQASSTAIHARNLIHVGKHAQARIIETYLSLDETDHFTNTMTTIAIEEGGHLIHNKIQNESQKAFHIGNLFVGQHEKSRFVSNNIALGGYLVRNNLNVALQQKYAEAQLNGLYMGNDTQHIDNNTLIDHVSSDCTSHELYQGILAEQATAVFSGKILVRPNAQKTDAIQNNRCLLLSDDARINTKPQLEIYADDVKCTHGATVGQLDEEAIFYLQSRGIAKQRAKNLMIYAFAEGIIQQIKVESVRDFVDQLILKRFKENMNFVK